MGLGLVSHGGGPSSTSATGASPMPASPSTTCPCTSTSLRSTSCGPTFPILTRPWARTELVRSASPESLLPWVNAVYNATGRPAPPRAAAHARARLASALTLCRPSPWPDRPRLGGEERDARMREASRSEKRHGRNGGEARAPGGERTGQASPSAPRTGCRRRRRETSAPVIHAARLREQEADQLRDVGPARLCDRAGCPAVRASTADAHVLRRCRHGSCRPRGVVDVSRGSGRFTRTPCGATSLAQGPSNTR